MDSGWLILEMDDFLFFRLVVGGMDEGPEVY